MRRDVRGWWEGSGPCSVSKQVGSRNAVHQAGPTSPAGESEGFTTTPRRAVSTAVAPLGRFPVYHAKFLWLSWREEVHLAAESCPVTGNETMGNTPCAVLQDPGNELTQPALSLGMRMARTQRGCGSLFVTPGGDRDVCMGILIEQRDS